MDYTEYFSRATGFIPYPYQIQIAEEGFPEVLKAPTGTGKTEAVSVGWLWRRSHAGPEVCSATPRRLILALPMRTLVEQSERRIRDILDRLGLADEVTVRVIMGGTLDPVEMNRWRTEPEKDTIVIGTIDCIVSRALLRGYGATRASFPIDFALVTNGSLIVVDEVQLCVQATTTLRQIQAFQRQWGTAEPTGLVCMSATVVEQALDVIDNPLSGTTRIVKLDPDDDSLPSLRERLSASKRVERIADDPATAAKLAPVIHAAHVPGTLTLVMLNTVKSAVEVYERLIRLKPDADVRLVHSRFRGVDRKAIIEPLLEPGTANADRIVISTQSLEAGVDLDARTLITETAPWTSLVQRAGRCNRTGKQGDARLLWFPAWPKHPYEQSDLDATEAQLTLLEQAEVTSTDLLTLSVQQTTESLSILRRPDMLALFDTAPDGAGRDLDVGAYIRGDDQRDVQVAWVDTTAYKDKRRRAAPPPPDGLRCAVPITEMREFLKGDPHPDVLRFSPADDSWTTLRGHQVRPQEMLLVDFRSGGYTPEKGFQPTAHEHVTGWEFQAAPMTPEDEGAGSDSGAGSPTWVPLTVHLSETATVAETLVEDISQTVALDPVLASAVIGSAALHDIGKAHPYWQQGLLATSPKVPDASGAPFAKSPTKGRLVVKDAANNDRPGFRHELVSALMLMSPAGEAALEQAGVPREAFSLCRYLIAAHHGHIRLHPTDPIQDGRSGSFLYGLAEGDPLPRLDGEAPDSVILTSFSGGPGSWSDTTLALLDTWGPFRLAYAELLVRMADWRASAITHLEVVQ